MNMNRYETDLTNYPGRGVDLSRRTDWGKFYDLACTDSPGLTEEEFLGLFIKCDSCALINTHLMFHRHYCCPQTVDDSQITDPRRSLKRTYAQAGMRPGDIK